MSATVAIAGHWSHFNPLGQVEGNSMPALIPENEEGEEGRGSSRPGLRPLGLQQHIDGAGAPVPGLGRAEGHDPRVLPQPAIHLPLEHRVTAPGSQALAVDDPGTAHSVPAALGEKAFEQGPRLADAHAVEIRLRRDRDLSAT